MYTYIPISPSSCVSLPHSLSHPSRWSHVLKLWLEVQKPVGLLLGTEAWASTIVELSLCLAKAGRHHIYIFPQEVPSSCPASATLHSASISRGELLHTSGAPVCTTMARKHLYIVWLWWPSGLMLTGPTGR